jgi:serine/threonine-protein kinase
MASERSRAMAGFGEIASDETEEEWIPPGEASPVRPEEYPTVVAHPPDAPAPRADLLLVGKQVGGYAVDKVLGLGGCAIVYLASEIATGRRGAMKVLHSEMAESTEMVERFFGEVRAINLINHPAIVEVWDVGRLPDGSPYFFMELLEGQTLRQLLAQRGALPAPEALELLEPICSALQAAHGHGIVHRDLKDSNILVSCDAQGGRVKLLDFGIAKITQPDQSGGGMTSVGRKLGTPTAMSPEQIRGGAVDRRTDIYALGVLLYQLLTGTYPFDCSDVFELERMHLERPPPRPSAQVAVSPEVDAVVLRCLEKQPERRFESVTNFLDALRAACCPRSGPAAAPPGATALAIAVLLEVHMNAANAGDDLDDALLDDITTIFDDAARHFADARLHTLLQTGSSLLVGRTLPADAASARVQRAATVEAALALHAALLARAGCDARVTLALCLHVGEATLGTGEQAARIVGGEITQIGRWMPSEHKAGVLATPATLADLDLGSAPDGQHRRLRPA